MRGRLASPWVLYRRPGRAQGLLLGGRHLVCWARAGCRRAKAKSPGFPKLTPGRALEAVWHSVLAKPGGLWYSQEVPGPRSSVDRAAASGAVCGRSSRPGGISVSPQGEHQLRVFPSLFWALGYPGPPDLCTEVEYSTLATACLSGKRATFRSIITTVVSGKRRTEARAPPPPARSLGRRAPCRALQRLRPNRFARSPNMLYTSRMTSMPCG